MEAASDGPGPEEFLRLIHSQDQAKFTKGIGAVLSGGSFEDELRLAQVTNGLLRIHIRVIPICDRAGEVVSVVGQCRALANSAVLSGQSSNTDLLLAQAEQIASFGTWEFDVESRCGTLSTHLSRMLGIEPGTKLSEAEYWDKVHPDDRAHVLEAANAGIVANRPFQFVARYFPPAGGIRHHFVRGLPITGEDGAPKSVIGITLDFSDQTYAEGELHRLSQQLMRARDEERRTVARELHESTGQTLAALKMSLGRLRMALPEEDDGLHGLLQSAVDLAEDAVREVRTLSYLMHPPMLDEAGLRSALHWYAKGFSERSGISVQVDIPQDFGRLGQDAETTIFRIVQEALTNVHRYSGSRTATIRLSSSGGSVAAIIQDEGCGLPSPTLASGRNAPLGVGIVGMRERVKQLNGKFEVESAPGKGTTIRVVLPVEPKAAAQRTSKELNVPSF